MSFVVNNNNNNNNIEVNGHIVIIIHNVILIELFLVPFFHF